MRVYPEQLAERLKQGLASAYLLAGNEPLLLQETADRVRQQARDAGFLERHSYNIDNQLDWNEVLDNCQALSLFSSRQIIELIMPDSGITATQAKSLQTVIDALHPDILLLVQGPRLNKKQESSAWFKALTTQGIYVPCNTPDARQLPRFIQQRCQQLGLSADAETIQILAQWHEGNLLALAQSLHKLTLIYPDGTLTLPRIQEALNRHNHYTPFQLLDALLAGQAKRSQRIVRQLEAEGVEAIIVLRTLQRELTQLYRMQEMGQQGIPLNRILENFRVWQNRRELYVGALHRLPLPTLLKAIQQLSQLERQAKTDYDTSVWPGLSTLCAMMCGLSKGLPLLPH